MSYTLAYTGAEIDALLGKIDAIFVAEYGSTIYSEVTAAIAAGNKVIVANAGKVYVYAGQDDNSGYVFTQSGPNAAKPNATYVTLSTGNVWSTATVDLATLQQFYASLMEDTLEDTEIASFPDGANDVPVESLVVKIEAMQAGSGDPSPDNIRPIYSQAEKNILPFDLDTIKSLNTSGTWSGNAYTYRTVVCTIKEDGELEISGTATGGDFDIIYGEVELSAVPYILSSGALVGNASYLQLLATGISDINTKSGEKTFTPPAVTATARVHINSGTTVNALCSPMLRSAANPDPNYVPYRCVARIDVVGKNILDPMYFSYPSVYSVSGDVVSILAGDNRPWVDLPILPLSAGTYTLSRTNTACSFAIRTSEDGYATSIEKGVGQTSITFTLSVDGGVKIKGGFGTATYPIACSFQLELAPTATPYEARKDRTYFSLVKDIWDQETEVGGIDSSTGENTTQNTICRSKNYIPVEPNTNYYYKYPTGTGQDQVRMFYYDASQTFINSVVMNINSVFTTPSNCGFIRIVIYYGTTYNHDIAILTAPPEIWGGELNVTTGELKVTYSNVDAGTVTWGVTSNSWTQCTNITDAKPFANASVATVTSSAFIADSANNVYGHVKDNSIAVSSAGVVQIYAPALLVGSLTSAQVAEALSGVQILYELATPLIFHIDPVTIKTWLATNNIICNTGKIKLLVYRCNTALYIQKMLGGNVQTLGMSPLSIRRPVSISQEDIDQADEVSDAFTEALDFEPYDEPEAEEPEELTEEPEAEEEPAEDAEAEPEDAEEPEA